ITVAVKYGFGDIIGMLGLPGQDLSDRILNVEPDTTPHRRIRRALDDLGPTFIKFGQIMSLRSDLLPKPLIEELQQLQDKASPVDAQTIRKVIRQNIDGPWEAVFFSFDETPLAAASLSQVHRAVLRDGLAQVALKVQRPDIAAKIDQDLSILGSIAKRIHDRVADLRNYALPELVDTIRRSLARELDFSREGRYVQIARGHLADLEGVYVPRVYMAYTRPQLLVLEYVSGESLNHLDRESLADPALLAGNGLRATVRQIFEVGFFHADPHPGNMLVSEGKTIILLDWGMVGRLTAEDRYELVDLITAIVEKDSRRLVDALLTIAAPGGEVNRRSLERSLMDILDAHLVASVGEIRLGRLVMEIMEMIRQYRLKIPADLFMMIKSLVTAESTVRMIHPEMDIVAEIRPHLESIAVKRFHPESIFRRMRGFLFKLTTAPTKFPRRIGDIVEKMEQGRLRVGFEHRNLDGLQHTLEKTFSRLTMGVILAALIIGSSLIITTGIPPIVLGYPLLGLAGYLVSALLGLWLV
ncbi:MAG TPA: AarF/UbiB family protein, partial [Desulfosarcina sp.]|nr:AarF/UbiB family protein [Desulfosarcina sp.]